MASPAGRRSPEYYVDDLSPKLEHDEQRHALLFDSSSGTPSSPSTAYQSHDAYPAWPVKRFLALAAALLSGVAIGSWATTAGKETAPAQWAKQYLGPNNTAAILHAQERKKALCNPYLLHGELKVSPIDSENKWVPVRAPEGCDAVDYMTKVRDYANSSVSSPFDDDSSAPSDGDIDFVRGKTVLLVGDSIDRIHINDSCWLLGGEALIITANHELTVPYPPGHELPFEGYRHGDKWPSMDYSRPFYCYIERLDFLIASIFTFGYEDQDDLIGKDPHFYPPAMIEDRVDQVAIPVLENLAKHFNRSSSTPDLVEVSPTFWTIMRIATLDEQREKDAVESKAMTEEEAHKKFDVWRPLDHNRALFERHRTEEVIRHVGSLWADAEERPRILWRSLHHIKEWNHIAMPTVFAIDQIARAVVEELQEESREAATATTEAAWDEWPAQFPVKSEWNGHWNQPSVEEKRAGAKEDRLDERLFLDNWGDLINGQEFRHFRDHFHPDVFPGSWLWGNMMFQQLKELTLKRQFAKEDAKAEAARQAKSWKAFAGV